MRPTHVGDHGDTCVRFQWYDTSATDVAMVDKIGPVIMT